MNKPPSRTKYALNAMLATLALAGLGAWMIPQSAAQSSAAKGTVEKIKIHGTALEGNLEGDSPDRDVLVYLPPSYATSPTRHYPVVYFLHGYGLGAQQYWNIMTVDEASDREMSAGNVQEMIVVLPDANTVYNGSMYSSSPVTGDWETYIAHDVVDYIDASYRTIPQRDARGLSGHSMGGYGTLRIGMKYPEVFGSIYAMSACCLMNNPQPPNPNSAKGKAFAKGKGAPNGKGKGKGKGGFMLVGQAQAAAWSPDPGNPPDYLDMPVKDGEFQPIVAQRYIANSPIVMVDQYIPELKSFDAMMVDIGTSDTLFNSNELLEDQLKRLQIPHTYETYDGDHTNRVKERFASKLLPFFSQHLTDK